MLEGDVGAGGADGGRGRGPWTRGRSHLADLGLKGFHE